MDSYILKQIDRLGKDGEHPPKIKISSEAGETKWIDISWDALAKVRAIIKTQVRDN